MITKSMRLNSKQDAAVWANSFATEGDYQVRNLATWIWDSKPFIGCTQAEHPLAAISDAEFWDICEGVEGARNDPAFNR